MRSTDRTLRHEGILDIVSQLVGTSAVRFNGTKLNMKTGTFGSPEVGGMASGLGLLPPHQRRSPGGGGRYRRDEPGERLPDGHSGIAQGENLRPPSRWALCRSRDRARFRELTPRPQLIELKAGDISIHHVRTLHASMPNVSTKPRRLLLLMYCSGDSFSLHSGPGQIHDWEGYRSTFLRGEPSQNIRMENCPLRVPFPTPLRGGSIYETQSVLNESTLKGRYGSTGADWPR